MYKRIDYTKLEGIPLFQETLDFQQTSYRDAFAGIAQAFGTYVIIAGVADLGANYGDGWVVINGELMPFVGGLKAAQIIVEEITDTEVFGDSSVQTVYYTRRAKCAATGGVAVSTFVRISSIASLSNTLAALVTTVSGLAVVPSGTIMVWSGSIASIPAGWKLCDGTSGTPNLKGKFIVGYDAGDADYNTIGNTGGEKKHTLITNELPAHSHTFQTGGDGAIDDTPSGYVKARQNPDSRVETQTTSSVGGGASHENRPPYYTLAYIMKS
jgi:hypothetical protein